MQADRDADTRDADTRDDEAGKDGAGDDVRDVSRLPPTVNQDAPFPRPGNEGRFSTIVADYLAAIDAGEKPHRDALLRRHPELADALRSFFDGEDQVAGIGRHSGPGARDDCSPPQSVGDYELLDEIARGGMGVVYRARQKSLKRLVALKMMIGRYVATGEAARRFRREAEAVARLEHPNIVPIYEIGEEEGQPYYSMKLFEGGSLVDERERLHGNPRAAAEVIETVARAIHFAHERGVLHRDLKPGNILLDGSGRPHVADFGLARAIASDAADASVSLTQTGAIVGTPLYMAPEQASGEKSQWGPAMDIYSLGAMLFEFLTGGPPFRRETPMDTLHALLHEDPPQPRTLNPKTPRDLETIAMKCLEKDPARRYRRAGDLADDLDRFLNHQPILARPPGLARRIGQSAVRHPAIAATLVVALLTAAVFGGGSWYRARTTFFDALASTRRALEGKKFDGATQSLHHLVEAYGTIPPVVDLARELSGRLHEAGESRSDEYRESRRRLVDLKERWNEEKERNHPWQPPWERREEIALWKQYITAWDGVETDYSEALGLLRSAAKIAPAASNELQAARESVAGLLFERYEAAQKLGAATLSPGFFKTQIEEIELEEYTRKLEGAGTASFAIDPPGAAVYCFRYENYEERLLPIPFDPVAGARDPAAGLVGAPYLEVAVVDEESVPFAEGDRWLEVNGRAVEVVGDLSDALSEVGVDESVKVVVRREAVRETVDWVPFPKDSFQKASPLLEPGRVLNVRAQFGFAFAGYPLDFVDRCRIVPPDGDGARLDVDLPRGSYLLVFRKKGYADTRYPLVMPGSTERVELLLFKESEIPPGFVYIPEGPFDCGGDEDAFQSMELAERHVDGFFLGRFEVTVGEYLEFLNDPEVFPTIKSDGTKEEFGFGTPRLETTRKRLNDLGKTTLRMVPRLSSRDEENHTWRIEGSRWTTTWHKRLPIFDIPQLAAIEYAHWKTQKDGKGWRYRLPTDLEWEKAARGADRRKFVWGNYLVWSYCWSYRSQQYRGDRPATSVIGKTLSDESVYGVRDLAGSVGEHTADKPRRWTEHTSIRGGDWRNGDDLYLHAATRNGRLPYGTGYDVGFRLAADLKPRR